MVIAALRIGLFSIWHYLITVLRLVGVKRDESRYLTRTGILALTHAMGNADDRKSRSSGSRALFARLFEHLRVLDRQVKELDAIGNSRFWC
jgi:hypothetical protein